MVILILSFCMQDDIIIIAQSVSILQDILISCELELTWLDMCINEKNRNACESAHGGTLCAMISLRHLVIHYHGLRPCDT